MVLLARRSGLTDEHIEVIQGFGAECASQVVSLQTVVGTFFAWLQSQSLTHEQSKTRAKCYCCDSCSMSISKREYTRNNDLELAVTFAMAQRQERN